MSERSPRWAVMQSTMAHSVQPYWAPDDEKVNYSSFLFFSPRDAKRDLLLAWRALIDEHLAYPDNWDDDDLPDMSGWIQQVDLHPDKAITGEDFEWEVKDIYGFFGMEVPK